MHSHPTPRAKEDRAHPFDGAAGDRSAGADHSDHHRAEKGPHAQALHRRPPQRTPKTNRNRPRPRKLGGGAVVDVCRFQSGGTPIQEEPGILARNHSLGFDQGHETPLHNEVPDQSPKKHSRIESNLHPAVSLLIVVRRGMILAKTAGRARRSSDGYRIKNEGHHSTKGSKSAPYFFHLLQNITRQPVRKIGRIRAREPRNSMRPSRSRSSKSTSRLGHAGRDRISNQSARTKTSFMNRKRKRLQDLFRTLLHELMTAKTRVQNLTLSEDSYE